MPASIKDALSVLVSEFNEKNARTYNESQIRLSFIDKFWTALGWDVGDIRQVRVETRSKHQTKPDYRFFAGRKTAFFVEAKKPSENLLDPKHIFQAKAYCWSDSVPLVVLTDFEEFRPFRALGRPDFDKPRHGLIQKFDLRFEQYPDHADELHRVFGRDAVMSGSLAELTKPTPREQKETVDKAFLAELSNWRKILAIEIAKRNAFTSEYDLGEAIQRIIDRIVFLRIMEDREVETGSPLRSIVERGAKDVYKSLVKVCHRFSPKYNGLIFNPHPLSDSLVVEDSIIRPIIKSLYEDSPYRFDIIPVEVLGTIYERFLGDEIRLDSRGIAHVDQKPDVRKAGGVYYTPQYIVEYIVSNSVGLLLNNCRTLSDVSKLKILDPACGSGSFLLGAFQALIDWHEMYFLRHPNEFTERVGKRTASLAYIDQLGDVRLTSRMKGRILVNSIFGVDLDRQATEVAQMSLYLKVVEGLANEPEIALGFEEAILPKLDKNIQCGNSLISSDFLTHDFFGLSEKEQRRINPFDWAERFPFLTQTHGFDAIIGNPPYGALFGDKEKNYLKSTYKTMVGKYDSYGFFFEKALQLLGAGRPLGFITPHTWLTVTEAKSLRKMFLNSVSIRSILRLPTKVFEGATVNTVITLLTKEESKKRRDVNKVSVVLFEPNAILQTLDSDPAGQPTTYSQRTWSESETLAFNVEVSDSSQLLLDRIRNGTVPMESLCDFSVGIQAYDSYAGQDRATIEGRLYHSDRKLDKTYRKELNGVDVGRYSVKWPGKAWVSYGDWLAHPRDARFFTGPRILVREITGKGSHSIYASLVEEDYVNYKSILNVKLRSHSIEQGYKLTYFLGILNSRLMSWYFPLASNKIVTQTFPRISILDMKRFPIRSINFDSANDRELHDRLSLLVQSLLDLNLQLELTKSDFESGHIQTLIDRTDKEVDALVFQLYGLKPDEISIIETTISNQ